MGVSLSIPNPIHCDNISVIQITHNSVFHEFDEYKNILKLSVILLDMIICRGPLFYLLSLPSCALLICSQSCILFSVSFLN